MGWGMVIYKVPPRVRYENKLGRIRLSLIPLRQRDSGRERASERRWWLQQGSETWMRARHGCACGTWRSRRANARSRLSTQFRQRAAQEREHRGCSDGGCEIRPGGTGRGARKAQTRHHATRRRTRQSEDIPPPPIHATCRMQGVRTPSWRSSPRSCRCGAGAEGVAARGCAAPPPPPHMDRTA
ncbi:hypothetical protein C8J57DRAFT_165233 [Mycena rebaudengoi]|nr:hypothetical protein C8J57DRAFT_165233 [Mycena rebaudengoi]